MFRPWIFEPGRLAQSPVIKPLLDAYPDPIGSTSNPDVGFWRGTVQNLQDEDVGTLRVDHRFNDRWSSYFRFTRNHAFVRVPVALDYGNSSVTRR